MKLLTRDCFRSSVFHRDRHKCVLCKEPAVDAHHIIERHLFDDGGYYLDNGASLCSECHWHAESTVHTPDEIRHAAGIKVVVVPPGLSSEGSYDKWGNEYLPNGLRTKGPLFHQENVQKVLESVGALSEFTDYIKYPRTLHLPWSPGATDDDKILRDVSHFEGKEVVITEKLDGENCNLYRDHIHARSLSETVGEDRARVKQIWGRVRWDIPEGWRVCGENMAARHSIHYTSLPDWLMVFSIWNRNQALSWDDTVEWATLLGLQYVPILYRGVWDPDVLKEVHKPEVGGQEREGYVVRLAESFTLSDFPRSVAKYVREGHVDSGSTHWRYQKRVWNSLA